ncbi:MAG: hypothetical protein J6T90_03525 [Methanomicrobium sp.]|nr:hypothetical protein [Methanomicrobium sp.]MBP5476000.1 hypothetical protein [Methanomicrobium sp.]
MSKEPAYMRYGSRMLTVVLILTILTAIMAVYAFSLHAGCGKRPPKM